MEAQAGEGQGQQTEMSVKMHNIHAKHVTKVQHNKIHARRITTLNATNVMYKMSPEDMEEALKQGMEAQAGEGER